VGLAVPTMAGKLLVVDDDAAAGCAKSTPTTPSDFQPPFLLVAGHTDERLIKIPLLLPLADQREESIDLTAPSASSPFGVGLSCSPSVDGKSGTPRAWVSYQGGRDGKGYVAQVDLSQSPARRTVVYTGLGHPREFAYDLDHDRLYFTTQENGGKAPVRWLTVGTGCKTFDGGVQDEREGGCHVDPGFDLSTALSGAEPNELALSSGTAPCTAGRYSGQLCRRMYLSVRVFDFDQFKALNQRPSRDVGGKLVVLELPESSLGGPDPQWIRGLDIGITAGQLVVIPRTGKPDLVAVLAVDDGLLWLYDDEVGALVRVFARDPNTGVPDLGHFPSGLAVRPAPGSTDADPKVRIYVSSYHDNWVSAVDVPVNHPADANLVKDDAGNTLHLGVTP
jgi:hypothetical protein